MSDEKSPSNLIENRANLEEFNRDENQGSSIRPFSHSSGNSSSKPYRRNKPRQPLPLESNESVCSQEEEGSLEQNMNLYNYLNKYLYTANLVLMSCANFNLIGIIYMTDLLAQLICFYAFRRKSHNFNLFSTK